MYIYLKLTKKIPGHFHLWIPHYIFSPIFCCIIIVLLIYYIRTINILYLPNTYLSSTYNMASAILETWATRDKTGFLHIWIYL